MSMKFCKICKSIMVKNALQNDTIMFICRCQYRELGEADDTLMLEKYLETSESLAKHDVFLENAPFDQAANIVLKDCPKCGLNFLILTRIGKSESVFYVCSCGYRASHAEYTNNIINKL